MGWCLERPPLTLGGGAAPLVPPEQEVAGPEDAPLGHSSHGVQHGTWGAGGGRGP